MDCNNWNEHTDWQQQAAGQKASILNFTFKIQNTLKCQTFSFLFYFLGLAKIYFLGGTPRTFAIKTRALSRFDRQLDN